MSPMLPVDSALLLRHRSASKGLRRCWEYDPTRRCIIIAVEGQGADIPVCAKQKPRFGAFEIVRVTADGAPWRIRPSAFASARRGSPSRPAEYPNGSIPSIDILLTRAPPHVMTELEELFP